jgi:hypothetical protein
LSKPLLICVCVLTSLPLSGQSDSHAYQAHEQRTRVRNIVFENAALLSARDRRELTKRIREDDDSPKDVAHMAEERVRAAFQDKGYFKVEVSAAAEPVAVNAADRRYDIEIKILDSGQRYWLREIHFINSKHFQRQSC